VPWPYEVLHWQKRLRLSPAKSRDKRALGIHIEQGLEFTDVPRGLLGKHLRKRSLAYSSPLELLDLKCASPLALSLISITSWISYHASLIICYTLSAHPYWIPLPPSSPPLIKFLMTNPTPMFLSLLFFFFFFMFLFSPLSYSLKKSNPKSEPGQERHGVGRDHDSRRCATTCIFFRSSTIPNLFHTYVPPTPHHHTNKFCLPVAQPGCISTPSSLHTHPPRLQN